MPNPIVYAGYVGNRVRLWIICESCRRQIFLGSTMTSGPAFTPPACTWCHPQPSSTDDEEVQKKKTPRSA